MAGTNLGVVRGSPDREQSEVRTDFVAQSPETLAYDGDGNLVRDGRWLWSRDAENRLIRGMSYGAINRAGRHRVDWGFDAPGRRTGQTTYVLSNGVWVVTEDLKFVSDPAWFGRHIAELNATNHALLRSYVWGLDLSETLDAVGGVGGLLMVHSAANGVHFYGQDGNGNAAVLVKASDGTVTAKYEYGPFGEVIRGTGPLVEQNSFGFSTKRTHRPTRLVLYEFCPYDPNHGRWPDRDPLRARGGLNLYGFVGNSPLNKIDHLGLAAAIINHGGYTGHTSFVIINSDGSVKAYHLYAKSYQTGECCGLGSPLSVCCDNVSVWSETSGNLTHYLQSQQALAGDVKIVAYALGTPLDDQLSLEDLDEQDKADAGIYSLAAGIESHKKSWDWFNEYLEGGPEIHPTLLPGQPWSLYWPERWFETRPHRQQSFPQVPASPTPAPAP